MRYFRWMLLCGLVSAAGAQTRATQFNLSRDLVGLGIANRNLVPNNPSLDAVPLLQAALDYAAKNRTKLITADAGTYYFLQPQAPDRYVGFNDLKDLTVDFQGSDLYFRDSYLIGFAVIDCLRVKLANFTVDAQNLPFTQARLTGVSGRTVSYQQMGAWASPSAFNSRLLPDGTHPLFYALVFRNGLPVPGTNILPVTLPIGGSALQVAASDSPWTQPSVLATYQPGDTIVMTGKGGESPILVAGGNGVTLSNIAVYASGALAVHFDTSGNSVIDGVRVIPRPGTDRLISSNADGIHISYALVNNQIRNCFVSRTLDDGITLNSPFLGFVKQQAGTRQVRVDRRYQSEFQNGLYVQFVNPATAEVVPGAMIVAQDPPFSDPPGAGTATLTLDRDLPALRAGFGMTYADPDNRGAGSVIENNVVEDVLAARGIFLGGVSGVTVRGNTVRRTNCGAIVLHQDLASYPTGPNTDILIDGNTIEQAIGPSAVGTGVIAAIASIFVLSTDGQFNFLPGASNARIDIVNNTIADSGRGAIWVSNTASGSVAGNRIAGYYRHPELAAWGIGDTALSQLLLDFQQPIVVRANSKVQVSNQ